MHLIVSGDSFINHTFFAAAIALASSTSFADESSDQKSAAEKRHQLMIGATWQKADLEFTENRPPLPEVTIDQKDLGLANDFTSLSIDYSYRINDNWEIMLGAFQFEIDDDHTVSRDFNFDGVEFSTNTDISSSIKFDSYIAEVMYSIHRSADSEIMLGAGLHAFDFSALIQSRTTLGNRDGVYANASEDFLAPLPNIRAKGQLRLAENLDVYGSAGWLSATYDKYEGDFVYARIRLQYNLSNRFGVSIGYQFIDIDLTIDRASGQTRYDALLEGSSLQVSYRF